MKLALLATLLTFAGSLAGFGLTTGGGSTAPVVAGLPASSTDDVVVRADDHDCPKAETEKADAEKA